MPIVSSNFTSGWISRRLNNIKGSDVVGNGLLRADNVVVQVNGGVSKRPGLKFVSALASTRNKTFRRVFLWRRNETERLVLACATDGTIVILTDDGTEIPVENALNKGELRELRFYAYSTQGIFTDKREVRSILGIPQRLSAGAQFLLTSGVTDATKLKNFGKPVNPPTDPATFTDYEQDADQPISLSAFRAADNSAVLEVGELRSTFTPDAQGRASVFTNNPRTYKNAGGGGNTTITISSVALEGGNRLRLVLSSFPAWLEKAVVRWGANGELSREFTSANSQNNGAELTAAEITAWGRDSGEFSVELVRRRGDDANVEVMASRAMPPLVIAEQARWNAGGNGNTSMTAQYATFVVLNPSVLVNNNPVSGSFPSDTSGTWRLRQVGGGTITGALTTITNSSGNHFIRIGTATQMQAIFGTSIYTGGQWILEKQTGGGDYQTTGAINAVCNGVTITEISLQAGQSTLRVTAQGLDNTRRIVIGVGGQTITFAAGALTHELSTAQAAAWRNGAGANNAVNGIEVCAVNVNLGLEANDRDFIAVALLPDENNKPVFIRGRDFYDLDNARQLVRLPLKNRRVRGLVVDDEFNRQPASVLLLMGKRTLTGTAAELKKELLISRFIAFRQPFAPPPLRRHFSEQAYNAEIERLGNKRFGVNATGTENDIEWEANTPTNADGDELIPVKQGGGELRRVGVLPEFVDAAGADQMTRRTVWGWKKAGEQATKNNEPAANTPADPFDNPLIAHWGVLKTSAIANNEPLIGKPQGRYTMIWNDVDDYPATAVRSQGRLCYAGTAGYPSTIWMSFINDPANFLEARPAAGDAKGKSVQADYAIDLELEGAAIEEMIQDAVLLILTQNEAHTARGQFNATNLSTSILKSFGHFGQENNISVAVIDEHIFIYSSGAAFGFWYAGDDIGYQPQNISARRNEDIFRDENGGMLNVVRIAAAQPRDLNGAFMVLFLMEDGSIRVWHTLHKQEFFAWSRWNFFEGADTTTKIIDIAAQGEKVVLLANNGNLYELDGGQFYDEESEGDETAINITLETPSFAEPQYDGDALLYPKQVKSTQLYFRHISDNTQLQVSDDPEAIFDIPLNTTGAGSPTHLPPPPDNPVSKGARYISGGKMPGGIDVGQQDSEREYTMTITHNGKNKWELSRLDVDLEIGRTIQVVAEIRGEGAGRSAYRNPRIMGTP